MWRWSGNREYHLASDKMLLSRYRIVLTEKLREVPPAYALPVAGSYIAESCHDEDAAGLGRITGGVRGDAGASTAAHRVMRSFKKRSIGAAHRSAQK